MKWNKKKLCCLQTSLALLFATDFRVEAGAGAGAGAGSGRGRGRRGWHLSLFHFRSYFHSHLGTHLLFPKGTVNLFSYYPRNKTSHYSSSVADILDDPFLSFSLEW